MVSSVQIQILGKHENRLPKFNYILKFQNFAFIKEWTGMGIKFGIIYDPNGFPFKYD